MEDSIAVGILTIGTEVAQGEIVNSNAAWIANELTNLRYDPRWHLTVPDHRSDMYDALSLLGARVKVIIVTGGLGPTSDDFTRDVVAEWALKSLEYDPAAWDHICDRYRLLGTEPPESNRQQCYFPKGARVLHNARGTAHGFYLEAHGCEIYVLPGPPEEIRGIWRDGLAESLKLKAAATDAFELKRWHCLGIGESALAEKVEAIIQGSSLIAGYRPHVPFVEVKIWCKESLKAKEQSRIEELDATLSRWTVMRDEEDTVDALLQSFQDFDSILLDDAATLGTLSHRLGAKWDSSAPVQLKFKEDFSSQGNVANIRGPKNLELAITPLRDDGTWDVILKTAHAQKQKTLQLPFKRHPERWMRERLFICEQSLAAFAQLAGKGELIL